MRYFFLGFKKTILFFNVIVLFSFFIPNKFFGQETITTRIEDTNIQIQVAPVKLDGHVLFYLRGVSSFTAETRVKEINKKLKSFAENDSISADSIKIVDSKSYSGIYAGDKILLRILDADAEIEGIGREILAQIITKKISESVNLYRVNRSRPVIIENSIYAIFSIVIFAIILFIIVKLSKRINIRLQNRIKAKIDSVENISFNLIKSNQIWKAFHVLFNTLRNILIISLSAVFINYILSLFPWTNPFAVYLFNLVVEPILHLGSSFLNYIPKFIFLVIIYFITKYTLKLIKLFFSGLETGGIVIKDFHPEWAISTFKIVRTFIIAFAVIIAYPYIPGSDSVAFKGVSVFLGILFSIGSSGFIGNLIAGYSMIYRSAFRKGDYIEVEGQTGFVEEQQLLVTRLRSLKNEEIILPNSILLNSKIINYTAKAKETGIILHTVVGIGYETPWRQVDAMLKLAAKRTEGLLSNPPPFVQKMILGDFAVNYEINAYCKDVNNIKRIYTLLHENILDVFNENNVQIMTPSYVSDTEIPKVVPKDQWDIPLANEEQ
jgi:small-conductance mechanosensitive channel